MKYIILTTALMLTGCDQAEKKTETQETKPAEKPVETQETKPAIQSSTASTEKNEQ